MSDKEMLKLFKRMAIVGNILFVLWLVFNGIDEGFQASPLQKLSYLTLITLLLVNAWLLAKNSRD